VETRRSLPTSPSCRICFAERPATEAALQIMRREPSAFCANQTNLMRRDPLRIVGVQREWE
jgi:hypothetical protein